MKITASFERAAQMPLTRLSLEMQTYLKAWQIQADFESVGLQRNQRNMLYEAPHVQWYHAELRQRSLMRGQVRGDRSARARPPTHAERVLAHHPAPIDWPLPDMTELHSNIPSTRSCCGNISQSEKPGKSQPRTTSLVFTIR